MAIGTAGIEKLAIDTIRTLSMDAVQRANSGHPGTPMALAPIAYCLWNDVLRYDPLHPAWPARDRFVLSCGHASMLLYSVLHLAGVRGVGKDGAALDALSISLEDIRNFRQLGSPCAGHPEFGHAAGIETTTGPLGQGVATSVGMAIAAKWLSAKYDRPGFDLFGFNTYVLCSDGDLMEGISSEAASLAGHLKLSNLCWIYDDNKITIEGATDLAFSEDIAKRFEGFGWRVLHVDDANDLDALRAALGQFASDNARPTLIRMRSIIGYGAPHKQNSHDAHGAPLGEEEVQLTKEAYGWPPNEHFLVPDEVRRHFEQGIQQRGQSLNAQWQEQLKAYRQQYAAEAGELDLIWKGRLPKSWDAELPVYQPSDKAIASRNSSGKALNALAKQIPWMLGGSADLAPSNKTAIAGESSFSSSDYAGRNLHFGIREHAMAAISNGLALSGLRPYCGTFFVFTDYLRPAMRLSSLMQLPVLYVLTHDSIGLGEDGPTHQPIEHLAACRAIPGLHVFRPADANEVAECYRIAIDRRLPAAFALTRQDLPNLDRTGPLGVGGVARGGYILREASRNPELLLLASGSEVSLCVEAQAQLESRGVATRVVSFPCWELFEAQDEVYRQSVLPGEIAARIAVEAGVRQGWDRFLGPQGQFVGMSSFGASAPFEQLYEHFGITTAHIVQIAADLLKRERPASASILGSIIQMYMNVGKRLRSNPGTLTFKMPMVARLLGVIA